MTAAEVGRTREAVLEAVAKIAPVIEAHREEGERERRVAPPVIQAMREAGLFELWTPSDYGGREVEARTYAAVVEEISRLHASAGWVFGNLAAGGLLTAFMPAKGAGEIYAKGPGVAIAGSVQPKGRAVVVEGGYRVSGRWPLASGCHHGDWLAAVAIPFDGDQPRMTEFGPPDMQVMFFRPDECEILDTWDAMGLRATGSADLTLEDVFIPQNRAFSFFATEPVASGALYRPGLLEVYGFAICPVFLGIARSAIDAFVALAKEKTPTFSDTGLAVRPTIHVEVAKAEALLQSARACLYEVADEMTEASRTTGKLPEALEVKRRLACNNVAEACTAAVERVFALAGSTPVYSGQRLERCLRDVQTARQHFFVSPAWWEKTGQFYFGLGLGMP